MRCDKREELFDYGYISCLRAKEYKTDFDKAAVSGILTYSNKSYVPILFTYNVDITT